MDKYAIDPQLKKRKNFSFPFNRLVFPFANLFLSLLPKRFDKKLVKVDYLKVSNAKIHIVTPLDLMDKESPCLFYIRGGVLITVYHPNIRFHMHATNVLKLISIY